ncbi:MAG: tryptophan--tRNA ligase [Bacilli bacterium]|nr:tryptophan--tRNA ligase [Bacilli bacterium]MDD3422342.1 tryptophan--tRNA ligase [Bacilli bacterium]MDD4065778.1 tryptophan--tRNA ligase [Bacilli bacterium]
MDRMLSGIKPSGKLTLGNYIGAIRNFVKYQDEYELYIFIANLHAITVPVSKEELRKNTKDIAALYIACGLDPKKVTFFIQSDVLEHANLSWIFNCHTYMGELKRMTQFKDKSQKLNDSSINVGLFTYPDLMAADILIYDPKYIPVGEDQKQHVELTRDIAIRMNNKYGEMFTIPEPLVASEGARIMSLSNPSKKMSKSDETGDKGCIYLLDDPKLAAKKIMSAVTDSEANVKYDVTNKPGISNLMEIYGALSGKTNQEIEAEFKGQNYGVFKSAVADIVVTTLTEIQAKYKQLMASGEINEIYQQGAIKARAIANQKLHKVYRKLGIE